MKERGDQREVNQKLSHSLLVDGGVSNRGREYKVAIITPEINYLSIADPAVWFWLPTNWSGVSV